MQKRQELNNLNQNNIYNNNSNISHENNTIKNYVDINHENKKKFEINHKNKNKIHNLYTFSSNKKSYNDNIHDEDIEESFNFENDNEKKNQNQDNEFSLKKKCHTENSEISNKNNNNNININNEEIKIFNKYINIISENKFNQEKLSLLQNELTIKNEKIKNLEKKLKEETEIKDTLLEKMKKEKSELQKLLIIETQKTLALKKFAEEEQKKHIKYKNKFEKCLKKSKTEEKLEKKNQEIDYFIYNEFFKNLDDDTNISKLKEEIFKLKKLLDEEKNKNEILQLLSENQKGKHELVKNKYERTKKLNMDLMNKISEKQFYINKEISNENEALKKNLIESENKNDELRETIKKLNEEINNYKNNINNKTDKNVIYDNNNQTKVKINEPEKSSKQETNAEKTEKKGQKTLKPSFSRAIRKKLAERKAIPKSIDLANKFQTNEKKVKLFNLIIDSNPKNISNSNSKTKSRKPSNSVFFKDKNENQINLELNNSDNKDNSDTEKKIPKIIKRKKREGSEKVLRILNGNNISCSEFSSEKNFSDNNKGTKIGINSAIKENENEDDDEKFNTELSEIKPNNDENNIENNKAK